MFSVKVADLFKNLAKKSFSTWTLEVFFKLHRLVVDVVLTGYLRRPLWYPGERQIVDRGLGRRTGGSPSIFPFDGQ